MNLPDELVILGVTYDIRPMDAITKTDTMGMYNSRTASILIDMEMSAQVQLSTLWHELIHIIQFQLGVTTDETVANAMAAGIHELLTNNPALVECYISKKRKK